MRTHSILSGLLGVTAALCSAAAGAQDVTARSKEAAKAAEVLTATRKAVGPVDSVRTLAVDASVQRNVNELQMSSDVELLLELPDKYARIDTSTSGMGASFTSGFSGEKPLMRAGARTMAAGGAMIIRMGPGGADPHGAKPTPEQQAEMDRAALRLARHEVSRMMLGWFGTTHPTVKAEYAYAGEAESPDGRAHVIDVAGADGFAARLFVDQQTHLPLMVTYRAPQPRVVTSTARRGESPERRIEDLERQPPPMVDNTLFFSDWRRVDGVMFPHAVSRASGGTPVEEWKITRVRVNPRIDPRKFDGQG